VAPGVLPDWLAGLRKPLPPNGLLLHLDGGLSWFVAVPEAEGWFSALKPLVAPLGPATT
jgi:hypothetical protein